MRSSSRQNLIYSACAGFALLLGVTTLVGWSTGNVLLVRIRPDWTPMVVNTAIGFILSGAALLAAGSTQRLARRVASALALVVVLLAVEELIVIALDISPALSLPDLHRPLQPEYPHPGRMAPNTATCFLLYGAGLWLLTRFRSDVVLRWARGLAVAVTAIGLLGVIGYSLQLEYLYGWSGVVRMALQTGAGMVVLGVGLWVLAMGRGAREPALRNEVTDVYRIAVLLSILTALSAGIGGFAFLQGQFEAQVRDDMGNTARDRIAIFQQTIDYRSVRAGVAAEDSGLASALRAVDTHDAQRLAELRAWAARLSAHGFTFASVRTANVDLPLMGAPAASKFAVALRGSHPGQLLCSEGYVLRRTLVVQDADGIAGWMTTEQPLPALDELSRAANHVGESGEMGVCAPAGELMDCFPLRSRPLPSKLPLAIAGQRLPMAHAVAGESGSTVAFDYRRHRVLAYYGPIGDSSLGLVLKRDVAEIYAPIRAQFERMALFLATLVGISMLILRRNINPLLRALQESRARAIAAVESNLDAYFIVECVRDANGDALDLRYTLLNHRAERLLGRPRSEVIGQLMCELFPERRTDGMLKTYVDAIESGEPIVEERSAVAANGMVRWYHLQAVKLGDGLGVTVRDITTARHAAERIRHQAMHDSLTGLTNRAGYELALAAAIAEAESLGQSTALALIDVDGFKAINDTLGHDAGDYVLREIGLRLRDCVRPADTVARLGGDEFVIDLPNTSYPAGAAAVARKFIAGIAQPVIFGGQAIDISISVGMSTFPADGVEPVALLKCADAAMYRAKRAGRNGYALSGADCSPRGGVS